MGLTAENIAKDPALGITREDQDCVFRSITQKFGTGVEERTVRGRGRAHVRI